MTELITSADAPAPAGPYSPGLMVDGWIFLSGQGGFAPETGVLVNGGIADQTAQAFRNVGALLRAAGATLDDIVTCLVHLRDLSQFAECNASYQTLFPGLARPARTTVGADLVAGMLVEVTVIARKPGTQAGPLAPGSGR
jgi:2-iminobutanoate/2-iminopropanoate deaminase